jgi:glycerol-3-phosphate acyltransferase PlsX
MGAIYSDRVLGVSQPRVGVLSNGEEVSKGNDLTRAASEQLAATSVNYIGYVEGRDIFNGKVDVIVCDGFTGNIALKSMEGVASFAGSVLLSRKSLAEAYRRLDYAEYGGAPLIGLDGVAIVAHGGSSPVAIKNAIRAARDEVNQEINRHIAEALSEADGAAGVKKEGLPRKLWERFKSKIESLGDKAEPASGPAERRKSDD